MEGWRRRTLESLYSSFVKHHPTFEGHRGRTFVILVPGEVVEQKEVLHSFLEDIALLHGLGVRLVLVLGARPQINEYMREHGAEPTYTGGHRVTDAIAMEAAIASAGKARMEVEARLSKGPAVSVVRRHTRTASSFHYGPALQTVSGNYIAAKRKGIVNGTDYQYTGTVRFVQVEAVRQQLEAGHVVLLSNLGYSAAGEVLNCDIYGVATRAAVDLAADKLFCMTTPATQPFKLPLWVPLTDVERLLTSLLRQGGAAQQGPSSNGADAVVAATAVQSGNGAGAATEERGEVDFERWAEAGLPLPLMAAGRACAAGVKRAHLVDAATDGALLLELYSRDGIGTMISTDFYEGIRAAVAADLEAVETLLKPLEERGILAPRSRQQLADELPHFTVLEREGRLLGCAMVKPLGAGADGCLVGELGAFCVDPSMRGSGRGDSLLDYTEQQARLAGFGRVVLLTTRTADWFEQRGFELAGPAHSSPLLPEHRRTKVDPQRNSQLYVKALRQDQLIEQPAGKRIGF